MDTANSPDPVALGPPFQIQLQQGQKARSGRGRGHSVSTVPVHHSDIPSPTHSRSKSASVSAASFPTLPTLSPPIHSPILSLTATVSHSRRSSWWRREFSSESNPTVPARPWHATATDKPHATPIAKEAALVPAEQMENWDITRKRVAQAASSILGTSCLVAHEVLLHSVDLFELAPVPGLSIAARTLLDIWDCVQQVDSNRLQCLRLTERCADILLSVRQEVYEAGDEVAEELRIGVERLTESFSQVHTLLTKQASRPFLKRYLKRDEISKQLAACDVGLQEALGLFSLSIQIRILKQVQLAEARRQKDTEELLKSVVNAVSGVASGTATPTGAMSPPLGVPEPIKARSSFPYSIPSPLSPINSNSNTDPSLHSHSLLLSSSSSGPDSVVPGYGGSQGSESLPSLHISGLQGLPSSSSHSSLSLATDPVDEASDNVKQTLSSFQWPKLSGSEPGSPTSTVMPIVPSVSITPSSRPSTMGSTKGSQSKSKASGIAPVPLQLIPTKSTIEAAKGALEDIQAQAQADSPTTPTATSAKESIPHPVQVSNPIPPSLIPSPSTLPPSLILPTLLSLTQHQTLLDAESDYADLRGIMREALRKGSDAEMIGVLLGGGSERGGFGAEGSGDEGTSTLGRPDAGEMLEAIKTLQRAHEAILERERWEALRGAEQAQAQTQTGQVVSSGGQTLVSVQKSTSVEAPDIHTDISTRTITRIENSEQEGRPGISQRASSSTSTSSAIRSSMSMNALKKITRRMSLQSPGSATVPSPLNETGIIEEETVETGEVGDVDVGVDMAVVRKMGLGMAVTGKGSSSNNGSKLIRSKTTSSATTTSTTDSILSQAGSGSSGSGSGSGVTTNSGSGSGSSRNDVLTLDKEFIESGIDALRRMSRPTKRRRGEEVAEEDMNRNRSSTGAGLDRNGVLPSWTITRYEIDREEKIGIGFFSDVYKGTWRPPSVPSGPPSTSPNSSALYPLTPPSRTVAIKVLAETTPRALFLRETAIWKTLAHPNVLELYGASSAWGDPPWFFVSPYMGNGSLAEFLRGNTIRLNTTAHTDTDTDGLDVENGSSRIRAASLTLPGYPGWSGGGLGSLVGARSHSPAVHDAAFGLGASAAHPYGSQSKNGHTRDRSGSDSAAGAPNSPSNDVGWASLGLAELEEIPKEWDLLRFMHEIAKGMEYLHSRGVLHGDLKASNVLVDDKIHCVISDFGQSEMRSEAYRISGTPPPHGTLRWQAPELMSGSLTQLTVEMDVYAFAICCTEVLSLGRMPWPFSSDDQVHNQVMSNQRPAVPHTPFTTPELISLVHSCWATNPFYRPPFSKVASELKGIRKVFGTGFNGAASTPRVGHLPLPSLPSPDMRPIPLPSSQYQNTVPRTPPRDILNLTATANDSNLRGTPSSSYSTSNSSEEEGSFRTARDISASPHDRVGIYEHRETAIPASLSLSASTSSASTITPNTHKPSPGFPFAPAGALPFSPTSPPFSPTAAPFSPTSSSAFSFSPTSGPSSFVPGYRHSGSGYPGFGHSVDAAKLNPSLVSSGTGQGQLQLQTPETVIYTPSRAPSSAASSIFTSSLSESGSQEESYDEGIERKTTVADYDGYDSPPPVNELIAEARNERRYRLLLVHDFHPSLTLPLWTPTPVALGAIGYLSKPKGEFVTLFNAFNPQRSASTVLLGKDLPSVHGYGKVSTGSQRQDKRNAAQRGLDAIAGLLTFKGRGGGGNISKSISRRYTFPLRAGHKTAYLCTETTMYRYVDNLDAPKKWFKANVDAILDVFGAQHHVQKEDLYFVIGTLDTPEHALFVSHSHPDGQAHFNVFSSFKSRQPWGTFTTDTETPHELGGPTYHEPVLGSPISASKVSPQGGYPWNTVLLARLRFKPDVLEPTSL